MANKPTPARAAGSATPARPKSPTAKPVDREKALTDRVLNRRAAEVDAAVPTGIMQRAKFRRNTGDPDDMALRGKLLDASEKRKKRDLGLIKAYGADAPRARSFGMKEGGKVSEYGGKENYKSKASMMKHEGMESPAAERAEKKMAKGGMCRGMGAATKGGTYKG